MTKSRLSDQSKHSKIIYRWSISLKLKEHDIAAAPNTHDVFLRWMATLMCYSGNSAAPRSSITLAMRRQMHIERHWFPRQVPQKFRLIGTKKYAEERLMYLRRFLSSVSDSKSIRPFAIVTSNRQLFKARRNLNWQQRSFVRSGLDRQTFCSWIHDFWKHPLLIRICS